jgi:hypothetical protein
MSDVTVTGNVQISENASLTIDATEAGDDPRRC